MKLDKRTREIFEDVWLVIFIGFVVVLCWLCQGCKTYHVVEVEVHDTLVVKDSVNITDTVIQTRIEKQIVEKEIYKDRTQDYTFGKMNAELGLRVDTVRIFEKVYIRQNSEKEALDSLVKALSYYKTKDSLSTHNAGKKEKDIIEKPLTFQQKMLMMLGEVFFYLMVIASVGTAAYLILRKCSRKE